MNRQRMIEDVSIRTNLIEADIGKIVRYHNDYYFENHGFNHDFGRYVEGPLTEFYLRNSPRERIWLLQDEEGIVGCIALARVMNDEAQLRWFFVEEKLRGKGYGQKLINLLICFAVEMNYKRIVLWTVSLLEEARKIYERNGFILEEEHLSLIWGKELVEQKYVKQL